MGSEMCIRDSTCTLENTTQEKDLGVVVDPLLNFEDHINCTVSKGNIIAGLLVRTITNKSPDILIPLYKALFGLNWSMATRSGVLI